MVLSACSPYFKALLEENPAKHPIIILKDVPFQHLTAILEFMYAGEVNVDFAGIHEFQDSGQMLEGHVLQDDDRVLSWVFLEKGLEIRRAG